MTAHLVITVILVPIGVSILLLFCNEVMRRLVCHMAAVTIFCCACLIAYSTGDSRELVEIALSGWEAPLGIRLYLDGLSALLLLTTAVIAVCITVYADAYFGKKGRRGRLAFFWPLWFLVWAALNALFVSGDAFNLYVTLEIINLAAVAMVALPRSSRSLQAALNYLVIAFLGSLSYLFGVAILYTAHGTLDLQLLAEVAGGDGPFILAAVLIFLGLIIKTALFPLHFWLPPAHASAPTPVSALLSGLVVTASAYMIFRLGFTVFASLMHTQLSLLLGVLGGLAVLWGSLHAFLQERVKMVVAYSTVAQLGYVFLALPVVMVNAELAAMVWYGVLYFVICHASAKAAAFLAAGTLIHVLKHDRIAQLPGAAQKWPMVFMAFGMAGVNLIGLPPSGGFIGKWLMLQAMIGAGQWLLVVILVTGSLLAAGYIFRVLGIALQTTEADLPVVPAPPQLTVMAMVLALLPLLLGVFSQLPFSLLAVGSPFGALP